MICTTCNNEIDPTEPYRNRTTPAALVTTRPRHQLRHHLRAAEDAGHLTDPETNR